MKKRYSLLALAAAGTTLLAPGLAPAQVPTATSFAPGRNSAAYLPQTVNITFSQAVTGAAGLRVFGSRWQGLMPGTATGDGTPQLTFQPASAQGIRPDELVSVTVPATVRGTGGAATAGLVYQFRTRGAGLLTGYYIGNTSLPEVGTSLHDPTLLDLNNDGKLDLLLADTQNDRVRLRLGTGIGTLGAATLLSTGEQPGSIAVADLNNDGLLDLLTSTNPATIVRAVTVALGNGQGGFGTPVAVPMPANTVPTQVRVGDLNADGNLDFVVPALVPVAQPGGPPASAALVVRLGNGQGGFTAAADVPVDLLANTLHVADFNNDGRLDCLVGSASTNLMKLYLGNGQGGFALAATLPLTLTGATDVADLTSDGVLDVLMADGPGNAVRVYPGTGTGGFAAATVLAVAGPIAVHAADVNVDGRPDVLATYNGGVGAAGLAVWYNNGSSSVSFQNPVLQANCAGTALVVGAVGGGTAGLVVVDNGLNGLGPNVKVRFNQPVLSTRSAATALPASCFPNPAHGTTQVLLPTGAAAGLHAEVYGSLGQLVRVQQWPAVAAGSTVSLDLLALPAGLYTLRLSTSGQTSSQPLVIE